MLNTGIDVISSIDIFPVAAQPAWPYINDEATFLINKPLKCQNAAIIRPMLPWKRPSTKGILSVIEHAMQSV